MVLKKLEYFSKIDFRAFFNLSIDNFPILSYDINRVFY